MRAERVVKIGSTSRASSATPLRMIKLTQEREITPYVWVHPDEER